MNRFELAVSLGLLGLLGAVTGCKAHIGSPCVLNTDCSTTGTLVCDNSQPYGYCTYFNCVPDTCQNEAACVAFAPAIPGCAYNDYNSPQRTARTMCLEQCHKDSDCREDEGYVCADPRQPPWNGVIVDDDQQQLVCVQKPDYLDGGAIASYVDAAVCQTTGPVVPAIDAGVTYFGTVDGGDAGADASGD
ncbi:MAG TPA: hypothetical protein VGL81_28850 [Polyangiaceae bacterium]|jgi:hypothetical protein